MGILFFKKKLKKSAREEVFAYLIVMSITTAEQAKSKEFLKCLYELLDFIEIAAPYIPEQEYIEVCGTLKKLNQLKEGETIIEYRDRIVERVRETSVVRNHTKRIRMKLKNSIIILKF